MQVQVVFLGTGTPNPLPDRWGPALAVVVDGRAYLVDAGVGIVRRAAAAAAKHDVDGLTAARLDIAFVTHLHSDHTLGLPDLLLTPWVMGRETPLKVFGPPGLDEMASYIRRAFLADIHIRLDGSEPANATGHRFDSVEVAIGEIYRDEAVTVDAIPVDHGSWQHAYGFKFTTPARTVVVSGDTRPCDTLVAAATGADVLVHEVYSAERAKGHAPEWQRYLAAFHTSTRELADVAKRAKPKLLILNHQLDWGATHDDLIAEIRAAGYAGDIASASDLDMF